jgi:hypothetical protein
MPSKPGSFAVINYLGYASTVIDMKNDWKLVFPFEKK